MPTFQHCRNVSPIRSVKRYLFARAKGRELQSWRFVAETLVCAQALRLADGQGTRGFAAAVLVTRSSLARVEHLVDKDELGEGGAGEGQPARELPCGHAAPLLWADRAKGLHHVMGSITNSPSAGRAQ